MGLGREPKVHCGGGGGQKRRWGLLLDNILMKAVLFMVVFLSSKIIPIYGVIGRLIALYVAGTFQISSRFSSAFLSSVYSASSLNGRR